MAILVLAIRLLRDPSRAREGMVQGTASLAPRFRHPILLLAIALVALGALGARGMGLVPGIALKTWWWGSVPLVSRHLWCPLTGGTRGWRPIVTAVLLLGLVAHSGHDSALPKKTQRF